MQEDTDCVFLKTAQRRINGSTKQVGSSKNVVKIMLASVENANNRDGNYMLIYGCLDSFVQKKEATQLYHIDNVSLTAMVSKNIPLSKPDVNYILYVEENLGLTS